MENLKMCKLYLCVVFKEKADIIIDFTIVLALWAQLQFKLIVRHVSASSSRQSLMN